MPKKKVDDSPRLLEAPSERRNLANLRRAYLLGHLPEQGGRPAGVIWCPDCTTTNGAPWRDSKTKLPVTRSGAPGETCQCRGRRVLLREADGRLHPLGTR